MKEDEIHPWEIESSSTSCDDFYLSNSERIIPCPNCSHDNEEGQSLDSSFIPNNQTNCSMCGGNGTVRQFIKIHSENTTQSFSRLLNRSPLSDSVVDELEGRLVYEYVLVRIVNRLE